MKKILYAILFCVLSTTAASGQGLKKQVEHDVEIQKQMAWNWQDARQGWPHVPQSSCTKKYENLTTGGQNHVPAAGGMYVVIDSDWYNEVVRLQEFKEKLPVDKIAVFDALGQQISVVVDHNPDLARFQHIVAFKKNPAPGEYYMTFQYGSCQERVDFVVKKERQ